jgi:hypothetical protein
LEALGRAFAFRNGTEDVLPACYAYCPTIGGGLLIRFFDAGPDDQNRPHCLRVEAAFAAEHPTLTPDWIAGWLDAEAWPVGMLNFRRGARILLYSQTPKADVVSALVAGSKKVLVTSHAAAESAAESENSLSPTTSPTKTNVAHEPPEAAVGKGPAVYTFLFWLAAAQVGILASTVAFYEYRVASITARLQSLRQKMNEEKAVGDPPKQSAGARDRAERLDAENARIRDALRRIKAEASKAIEDAP